MLRGDGSAHVRVGFPFVSFLLFILQNQLNKVVFAHLYNITILISRFSTCKLDAVDADGALL
jgi:hypothetical protein